MDTPLYDLSPVLLLMLVGIVLASGPLLWVYLRSRGANAMGKLQALTLVTLFLTFDLVLFGAFTRLSDSGLGCPDWPGCYGEATPLAAHAEISAAQAAMPSGPVTHGKAWIEMVHRYLATCVGVLIIAMTVLSWRARKAQAASGAPSPWWATATLVWVCIQGAFGALTVTMKLFPAIVSLHLLGGYTLLALLAWQSARLKQATAGRTPMLLRTGFRTAMVAALALLVLQAASGAWVSTNYAVLACTEFPTCQGGWWPDMDFAQGFELWRPLGLGSHGEPITFQALTAIHFTHRLMAGITFLVLGTVAARLWRVEGLHKETRLLAALLTLQLVTGVSNVVLGWPLLAAVLHTGGAGAMLALLVWMLALTRTETVAASVPDFSRRLTP
jgi:cytochrome c oxidase assembly protein subunit 15